MPTTNRDGKSHRSQDTARARASVYGRIPITTKRAGACAECGEAIPAGRAVFYEPKARIIECRRHWR